MKKIFAVWMLLCIALGADAQLLWKISGKNLASPSYVLGTHHLAPLSIVEHIAGFESAMNNVKQVYGEVVMDEMQNPASMQKMQKAILIPGDTTLCSLLNEAQYDSVAVKVKQLMGVDLKMFDKIKPAFLSSQLAVLLAVKTIKGYNPQEQLDVWIQKEAQKRGKTIGGLETVDFQLGVLFNSQNLKRQAEQLYCSVTNLSVSEELSRLMSAAYMKQDLKELGMLMDKKMGNGCDALPEEEEALVYGRNRNWSEQMPELMQKQATLFAVGSAHLPGERGVLNLLRKQGYVVEAVK